MQPYGAPQATTATQVSPNIGRLAEPVRDGEIPRELASLAQRLEAMESLLSKLGQRLAPVMTPETPATPEAGKLESVPITSMGNVLRSFTSRLDGFNRVLGEALQRLET